MPGNVGETSGLQKKSGSHRLVIGGTGVREILWHILAITRHGKRSWPRGHHLSRGGRQGSSSQRRGVRSDQKVKTTKGMSGSQEERAEDNALC